MWLHRRPLDIWISFLHSFRESWHTSLWDASAAACKKQLCRPTLRRRCQITTKPRTPRPTHRHPTTPPLISPLPTAATPALCRTCSHSNKETPPTSRPPSECRWAVKGSVQTWLQLHCTEAITLIWPPPSPLQRVCVFAAGTPPDQLARLALAQMSPLTSVQKIQPHTLTSAGLDPEGGQHRCFRRDLHRFLPVNRRPEQRLLWRPKPPRVSSNSVGGHGKCAFFVKQHCRFKFCACFSSSVAYLTVFFPFMPFLVTILDQLKWLKFF